MPTIDFILLDEGNVKRIEIEEAIYRLPHIDPIGLD